MREEIEDVIERKLEDEPDLEETSDVFLSKSDIRKLIGECRRLRKLWLDAMCG